MKHIRTATLHSNCIEHKPTWSRIQKYTYHINLSYFSDKSWCHSPTPPGKNEPQRQPRKKTHEVHRIPARTHNVMLLMHATMRNRNGPELAEYGTSERRYSVLLEFNRDLHFHQLGEGDDRHLWHVPSLLQNMCEVNEITHLEPQQYPWRWSHSH